MTNKPAIKGTVKGKTAAEQYAARLTEARKLMASVSGRLDAHALDASKKPGNWGYVGDLGQVVELLQELDQFLAF